MFRKCLKLLKNSPRTRLMQSGGRRGEIDRIKEGAEMALAEFSGETTQFCLERINRAEKS